MQMTVAKGSCLWGAFWGTSEESNFAYLFICCILWLFVHAWM